MKIIFLDIDGVLCTPDCLRMRLLNGHHVFNPACVGHLNSIIEATGAKLVLSSSWRHFMDLKAFNKHSANFGVPACISETPTLNERTESGFILSKERGDEIADWLTDHPEVTRFVVLDDNSDMEAVKDHFIQTDFELGLTAEHAKAAIKLLN